MGAVELTAALAAYNTDDALPLGEDEAPDARARAFLSQWRDFFGLSDPATDLRPQEYVDVIPRDEAASRRSTLHTWIFRTPRFGVAITLYFQVERF